MTKKKSHSKSSTKGSSTTNPQPTFQSALFQGSTPIQNVKKANQSAPKLPSPPELRQSTSTNSERTASQQDFPTLPSKPDKAKSFSSKDSPPPSTPKIAAPILAVPTIVPFIANIQDSIQDARNVKTVETSPLLPAQPVHVNITNIQPSLSQPASKSNAHIISITRYIIAMILLSIVIVSLWFLSGISFPWFIYPLFILAVLFQLRFFQLRAVHLVNHDKAINWLLLHTCMSLSFFATALVSWAYLYSLWPFPWILYVMALQFWLLVIHIGRIQFKWNYLIVHMWTYLTASCLLILTWYLTKLYIKEYVLGIAIYGTLLILGMAARKVYSLNRKPETKDLQSIVVESPPIAVIDKNQDGLYQIVTVGSQDYTSFPTLTKSKTTTMASFSTKYEFLKGEKPETKYQTSKF